VERQRELECLGSLIADAQDSCGRVVVIAGEAGIGKTALLLAGASEARQRGMRIYTARGGSVEQDFAYGVARQLLEANMAGFDERDRTLLLAGSAVHAAAVLGLGPPAQAIEEFAVRHGLYWLLANLADLAPVLVCIDDAHWADDQSWRWILHVSNRLDALRVGVALTWRLGESELADQRLLELEIQSAVETLHPAPLSRGGTAQVVQAQLGAVPDETFLDACYTATRGNPLYLRETLQALAADGVKPAADQVTRVTELRPERVAPAVLVRLARAGKPALQLARAVAVLDTEARLSVVAALARLAPTEAAGTADRLVTARLFEPEGPLRYVHPIVRDAVYSDIGPAERSILHRRAAELLCRGTTTADRGVSHLLRVEPAGDPWVVGQLQAAAARAVSSGAPDAAVMLLERALVEPPAADACGVVLAMLADAQFRAGMSAAPETFARAEEAASSDDMRRQLMLARGLSLWMNLRFSEAYDLLAPAAEHDLEVFELLAGMCVVVDDLAPRVRQRLDRIPQEGRFDTATRRALAVTAVADILATMRAPASAVPSLVRPFIDGGDMAYLVSPSSWWAIGAMWATAAYDEAEALALKALERARQAGSAWAVATAEIWLACVAYDRGDIAGSVEHAEAAFAAAGGDRSPFSLGMRIGLLGMAYVQSDRLQAADELFVREVGDGELSLLITGIWVLRARALLRLVQGDLEKAHTDALEIERRVKLRGGLHGGVRPWVVQILMQSGDQERAVHVARAEHEAATRYGLPHWLGPAERALGLVQGDLDRLQRSVELLQQTPCRLELAHSLVELGAALRRGGQRSAAREPLTRGMDVAQRCGAAILVTRARQELRASGVRPRRLVMSGIESLTPAELRTARLAAEGNTNREIAQQLWVSPKTIETQLRAAYHKLDIASRIQLREALGYPADDDGHPT
jgi:DNA-binding CsgD family transcriptional regulator